MEPGILDKNTGFRVRNGGPIRLFELLEPCEARSVEQSLLRASRLRLDDEQELILWWWSTDRFDFRHTVGAEGVKTHAVLCIDEILLKF